MMRWSLRYVNCQLPQHFYNWNHDLDHDFNQTESWGQFGDVYMFISSQPSYFGQASITKGDQGGDEEGYANGQKEARVDQELGKDIKVFWR